MIDMKLKEGILTFANFWSTFYYVTRQNKHGNKSLAKRLWDKTISLEQKKKAFIGINKNIKVSAYDYLKTKLNDYEKTK